MFRIARHLFVVSILSLAIFYTNFFAQEGVSKSDGRKFSTPVVVEDLPKYFKTGNIFFGPQPDEDALEWFAENGITLVVNNRTEPEITKHIDENFDEEECVYDLGMKYINIPLGGKDGYNPEAVEKLAEVINNCEGKILMHCTLGGRACHLFSAYLVTYENYKIDDALDIGKQMMLSFPFEKLLGYDLTFEKKE